MRKPGLTHPLRPVSHTHFARSHTPTVFAGLIALTFVQSSGFLPGWLALLGSQVVFSAVVSSSGFAALRQRGLLTSWSVSLNAVVFYVVGTSVALFLLLPVVMDMPPLTMAIKTLLMGFGGLAATVFVRPGPA